MQTLTVETANWWAASRPDVATWIDNYKNSLHARHRNGIAEIVTHYQPASLLEVGCHCGPNLIRLAQDVPGIVDLFGIDASPQAIEAGNAWASEAGLSGRVSMSVGRFPQDTEHMPSGCVDLVLSCYTLAYLAPGDLDAALFELGRLARRAVVLAEPMTTGDPDLMQTPKGYREWAHNYGRALKWIGSFRGMTLRMTDVQPPVDRLNAILVLERG